MNKTQAKRLLALATAVEQATDYDQNDYLRCAFKHCAHGSTMRADPLFFGISRPQFLKIFWFTKSGVPSPTGPEKARQIRTMVRNKFPSLLKKKAK